VAVTYLAIVFIFLPFYGWSLLERKDCEVWVSILDSCWLEVLSIGFGILLGLKQPL
jgi:hypothetical protein